MPVTRADIETEHHEALESLTREQRWALSRVQRAYQEAHFNHRRMGEKSREKIFEDEARRRNEAETRKVDHDAVAARATD